jgi:uncharacterized protein (DUF2062 family)
MAQFVQQRLVRPILQLLTQGITPEKIALSLAFGIMLGVFPVAGTTSLLCLLAALVFRLNVPALQLVNLLMYPVWFALLIPFIRLGERLFGAAPLALNATQLVALAHANLWHSIQLLWLTALRAAAAWMLIGPPSILVLYLILLPLVRRLEQMRIARPQPDGNSGAA